MSKIQIATTPHEMSAAIIKGFLENNNIPASYSPNISARGRSNISASVYVEEDKAVDALELLRKQGLIS